MHSWTGAGKHRSPHKWGVAVAWGNKVQPAPCFVASQPLFCLLCSCEVLTVLLIVTCAGGVATCQHLCPFGGTEELLGGSARAMLHNCLVLW